MQTFADNITRNLRNVTRSILGRPIGYLYKTWHELPIAKKYNISRSNVSHNPPFDIDLVYTWVDHTDPAWQKKKKAELSGLSAGTDINSRSLSQGRFHNRDELKYSLRSIDQYAPFINNIYIVTADQTPDWLDVTHPRIHIISHDEIMPDDSLPTFNANAIECSLHNIPGLAEHFIYMNDDMFIGHQADYTSFFTSNGASINHLSEMSVDDKPPGEKETGLEWGIKNSRKLIFEKYGKLYSHKLFHSPYTLITSHLTKLESLFPETFDQTRHSKFRNISDTGVTYALYQAYADIQSLGMLINYTKKDHISRYINLANPFLESKLYKLAYSRNFLSFCLNEPIDPSLDTSTFDLQIKNFLESYFPKKCQFEK